MLIEIGVGDVEEFDDDRGVRWLNQPSSEREKLVVAPTASSSAGSAAMMENRRDDADVQAGARQPSARQACHRPRTCHVITPIIATISTVLMNSTA